MSVLVTHLVNIKALIADPAHWTKGAAARDADNMHVEFNSPTAKCYCLWGAVLKETAQLDVLIDVDNLLSELSVRDYRQTYVAFNDGAEHDQVMAFLDVAIATAEARAEQDVGG